MESPPFEVLCSGRPGGPPYAHPSYRPGAVRPAASLALDADGRPRAGGHRGGRAAPLRWSAWTAATGATARSGGVCPESATACSARPCAVSSATVPAVVRARARFDGAEAPGW